MTYTTTTHDTHTWLKPATITWEVDEFDATIVSVEVGGITFTRDQWAQMCEPGAIEIMELTAPHLQ